MPQIREYQAETELASPIQTRQAREADTGGVGTAISELGKTVHNLGADMRKREAEAETADVIAKKAAADAQLSIERDQMFMNADPGDKTLTDKFMKRYDDVMSDIGSNISTPEAQRHFEVANAQSREQFLVGSMKTQSQMAGVDAEAKVTSARDSWSTQVMNDPSSFDLVLKQHEAMVNAIPGLDKNTRDDLISQGEEQLAKAQFDGISKINPVEGQRQLKSGKWDDYFNAEDLGKMEREAQANIHAQDIEQERLQKRQEEARKKIQETTMEVSLQKLYSEDGLSTRDVVGNKSLDFAHQKELLAMIERKETAKTPLKTDPGTQISLFDRIHLEDGDPRKITDPNELNQFFGRGLDRTGLDWLRKEVSGTKTPEGQQEAKLKNQFLNEMKGKLTRSNPMIGFKDPEGDAQYSAFQLQFFKDFAAARKAGTPATKLFDRNDPAYMGKLVTPFLRTPEQVIQSMLPPVSSPTPTPSPTPTAQPPPPKVGEIRKGYKYKGGEPNKPDNWEKAQ